MKKNFSQYRSVVSSKMKAIFFCQNQVLSEPSSEIKIWGSWRIKHSKKSIIVINNKNNVFCLDGALSGPRQFLPAKSSLKMMKNTFYFTSKTLFTLKVFKSLS